MAPNEFHHPGATELAGMNFRCERFPPSGLICAMMESDSAKLARIFENQRSRLLSQHEVIVLRGSKVGRFHPEVATHSKVNPHPTSNVFASPDYFGVVAREDKQDLLPAGD